MLASPRFGFLFLTAVRVGSDFDRDLEPEILLRSAVEWLPVADPERVEGRVRSELR